MHDSIMAQIGMDEHHGAHENGFGVGNEWADMSNSYPSSQQQQQQQHQSSMYENGGYGFMQSIQLALPSEPSFNSQRMPAPQPVHISHQSHQQLLPLIMPSHPTWPSMLTHPASYSSPPVAIPASAPPLVKGHTPKLPAIHATPSPRKTLTDLDRRKMCQYHEDYPNVKQTEIGAIFGVERSTVSKVLRQKDKYLYPEDRSLSPVKRAKGKFPDIERALANWVRRSQKEGVPLTDTAIREKARFFADNTGMPNNDSYLKTNSTSWLEKFKQKNGIGPGKLMRRASETNISETGSLNPESAGDSAVQTPNGISPGSQSGLPSPSPLSASKSDEDLKHENLNGYFSQANGGYRHSNSQSTTSLSSAFTDNALSSFSAGPTSPNTPFAFSPDGTTGSWMPSQQSRLSLPGNNFQRPRSQTFPMLGIDPSFISSQTTEPSTPKFLPVTAPSSALDSPTHELPPPFGVGSAISSPPLHHSSSNSSMAPLSSSTPITGLQSPPGSSAPSSPTQDDARRALDTLLTFFQQAPNGLVDQNEYMTVLKLTERLRLQTSNGPLPGGLHRIAEQEGEVPGLKMEQSMSAGC